MKTKAEVLAESQILQNRARAQLEHGRHILGAELPDRSVEIHFPMDTTTVGMVEIPSGRRSQLSVMRTIVATNVGSGFEYRVNERSIEEVSGSPPKAEEKIVFASRSATDALYMAYFSMEAQQLTATLTPFEPQVEAGPTQATPERVAKVESLMGAEVLSASERLRNRVDIVDFLQGRLSVPAVVQKAIHRLYHRQGEQQNQTLDHRQSMGQS